MTRTDREIASGAALANDLRAGGILENVTLARENQSEIRVRLLRKI